MTSYKNYHYKQFNEPYRSTIFLINFIKKYIPLDRKYKVLDVGCGAGANIFHIHQSIPQFDFEGLDIEQDLIKSAKKMLPNINFYLIFIMRIF